MEGIGVLQVFLRTRLNIDPYTLLKPTKVDLFWAEDLAAVNQVTQAVVRVGSRLGLNDGFM